MKKLVETIDPKLLEVLSEEKDGTVRLRIPFLLSDTVNGNRRRYPRKVVEQSVGALQTKLQRRDTYGADRHPKDKMEVEDVSHIIDGVDLQEDGTAVGVIRVLPTTRGKNVSAIIKAGGRIGVSARGLGSVKTAADGIDEVQDDFRLLGFDFVLNPSFAGLTAGKEQILESAPVGDGADEEKPLSEEVIKARYEKALGLAGYKGTLEQYRQTLDEARLKNLLQFRERHTFAKRQCGSKLDEEAFARAEKKE